MKNKKYFKQKIKKHNKERLKYIGGLIKEYRFETGLSRVDFSNEHGINRITIQNIENGKNITLLTLFRVLDSVYCPLNEFFYDVE